MGRRYQCFWDGWNVRFLFEVDRMVSRAARKKPMVGSGAEKPAGFINLLA